MKRNFKFIVAAIAAVAMVGCAKDGGEKIDSTPNGTPTTATFRVTLPSAETRAFTDVATQEESTIATAWGFLFDDATKTLETKTTLNTDGSAKVVTTTVGKHYIFVVANPPTGTGWDYDTDFVVADPSTMTAGMTMAAFLEKVQDSKQADVEALTAANKFFITGYHEATFKAPTLETPSPVENNITIGLGRGIAKVNMEDGHGTANPANVTVDAMKFKIMNNPIEMRAFQQYAISLSGGNIVNAGTINNEITGDGGGFGSPARNNYYRTAAYGDVSNANNAGIYIPENWNEVPTTHNASSLLIQGKVNIITTGEGAVKVYDKDGQDATAAYVAGSDKTFYRVFNKKTGLWLAPFFSAIPTDATIKTAAGLPGSAAIFVSGDKVTPDISAPEHEFYIADYIDALAYWRLPLYNEKLDKSVVARNDYFWVTIKTIAEIGASSDSEDPDEDGVLPGVTPTPIDKTKVDITAQIEVLKWNGVSQTGNI